MSPPFPVYVMWHPDSEDCGRVADRIRTHFQSPRFRHVAGGESVDVLLHSERQPGSPPFAVAWDVDCPIAIVLMIVVSRPMPSGFGILDASESDQRRRVFACA